MCTTSNISIAFKKKTAYRMHIVIVDLCLCVFPKTVFEKRRKYAEEI